MTPTLGQLVHVLVDPVENNGSPVAAAMITRVWSDETASPQLVNVRLTYDGPAQGSEFRKDWQTSVPLYESREAAEAVFFAAWDRVPAETRPVPQHLAFWPPKSHVGDGAILAAALA
jgi:hypothetical protein